MEHRNAQLIRQLFQAFSERDVTAIDSLIAADAVWRFPGHKGALAGEHQGREALRRFLTQVAVLTEGTFTLELHDVTASDDRAVALFTGRGQRGGKALENPTCLVMAVQDGVIKRFDEFVWDLEHVEDFWS